MAATVPYRKDARGRIHAIDVKKHKRRSAKRGTDRAFSPLFEFDYDDYKEAGGGYARDVYTPAEGDHEVWMEFLGQSGRGDRRTNDTQTLTAFVIDVTGNSSTLGFEHKVKGAENFTRDKLQRWDTVVIEPGTEFRFYAHKESSAALYITADHGWRKFADITDKGSVHVLDDINKYRDEHSQLTRVERERQPKSQAEREQIAARVKKSLNKGQPQLKALEQQKINAEHIVNNRNNTQGINAQPLGAAALEQLSDVSETAVVGED